MPARKTGSRIGGYGVRRNPRWPLERATGIEPLGKLTMPRCAVMPCEKNRGVARDTERRHDLE